MRSARAGLRVRDARAGLVGLGALMGRQLRLRRPRPDQHQGLRLPAPLVWIQRLNRETPRPHQRLLERWHRSLKEADGWLADLNFGTARQRAAGLTLKMRADHHASMCTLFSRADTGAMLDLKLETVSRTLYRFVREGAVQALDTHGCVYRVVGVGLLNAPRP